MKAMSLRRAFVAAAPIQLSNGRAAVVVAGGITYKDGTIGSTWTEETTDVVEVYDIEADTWSTSDAIKMETVW